MSASQANVKELLFGELAVRTGLVTEEQIQECLDLQTKYREGGQEVPHLHLHVLGGRPLGRMLPQAPA